MLLTKGRLRLHRSGCDACADMPRQTPTLHIYSYTYNSSVAVHCTGDLSLMCSACGCCCLVEPAPNTRLDPSLVQRLTALGVRKSFLPILQLQVLLSAQMTLM